MLLVVNYHYVGMPEYPFPGIHGLSIDEFCRHVRHLKDRYSIIGLDDLQSIHSSNDKTYCLLTFDDGLTCHYENVFPVLNDEGVKGVFFISTKPLSSHQAANTHKIHVVRAHMEPADFYNELRGLCQDRGVHIDRSLEDISTRYYRYDIELNAKSKYILNYVLSDSVRGDFIEGLFSKIYPDERKFVSDWYLSEEQILKMNSQYCCIGSHAHTHNPLAKMDYDQAYKELSESKAILEKITGNDITTLSYPLGSKGAVGSREADIAKNVGYEYAFTMYRGMNKNIDNPFLLLRLDCNDVDI